MTPEHELTPVDRALYQRSNEYLSRLNALDPNSGDYRDVYNDYLDTIDQISNRDFKASLEPTVAKFAPLARTQAQKVQAQPQTPSNLESFYINTPYGLSLHTPYGMEGVTLTDYPSEADTPDFLREDLEGQAFYSTLLDKISPNKLKQRQTNITDNILKAYAIVGNDPTRLSGPASMASVLARLESGSQGPQANTTSSSSTSNSTSNSNSNSPSNSEEQQIDADSALYNQYLTKAADYNNVRLSDLNAEARAITAGARNYLDDARGILLRATTNNFGSAFENPLPEALAAAYAYTRDVDATGQYTAGNDTTDSEGTANWDSLIASPREEQLKAFFDKYGGIQGFTSDPEDTTDSELATIRHDYELYTEKLLPTLRKAFNISDDAKARNIAGYMALQLLHKGTERNTALGGLFQDPYDYHSAATEDAYDQLVRALKDPGILATLDKMVRTNTALNKFEKANKAYNNAVTARNNREAALTSLYGDKRSLLQKAVSNDINKGVESSIYAREGLADSAKTLYSILNNRQG